MNNSFEEYMNIELIKRGYYNFEEVRIEDLQEVITSYFESKLTIKKSNEDIFILFNEYQKQANTENLEEIISYLLDCLTLVQGGESIEWWQFGHNREPKIYYDEETNKIVSLNTSVEIDYQKIFTLLMNTLIDLKIAKEEEMIR